MAVLNKSYAIFSKTLIYWLHDWISQPVENDYRFILSFQTPFLVKKIWNEVLQSVAVYFWFISYFKPNN